MCLDSKFNVRENYSGCDFVLQLDENRKNNKIKLLQLTDTQFIDISYRRAGAPKSVWDSILLSENFDALCGNQIKTLITQTNPDLIFITGDMVQGLFDDEGATFEWFCNFMDSFEIPWAPVFGNHENESRKGVKWQCEMLLKRKNCVFKRGNVTGNSNYSVGIAAGDELLWVLHMLDSNGCKGSNEPEVIKEAGIYPDQISLIKDSTERIAEAQGRIVPAFIAFHIPSEEFEKAEIEKDYRNELRQRYTLGVDVQAKNGDFGCKNTNFVGFKTDNTLINVFKECNVQAVFVGHYHCINTCIEYENIKLVFGLKTGQYDQYTTGQTGGTLVTIEGDGFTVQHVPSLAPYGPEPNEK